MVDWNKLSDEGDKRTTFEELCAQLIKRNKSNSYKQFIRNGTPDGGVEFYWKMNNNKIHGYQCKFFLSSLTNTQWNQVSKSIDKATHSYPNLSKYDVIVPQNLSDSRKKGHQTSRCKWNSLKSKMERKYPHIKFSYIGSSDIEELLIKTQNIDIKAYFFNELHLTNDWFCSHTRDVKSLIGLRYSVTNVDLPISKIFDTLCNTELFQERILKQANKIESGWKKIDLLSKKINPIIDLQKADITELLNKMFKIKTLNIEQDIEIQKMIRHSESFLDHIRTIKKKLENEYHRTVDESITAQSNVKDFDQAITIMQIIIQFIIDFLKECVCAETKQLLITGNAGVGKTHLLYDILEQRLEKNQESILLLGQQFVGKNPLDEIPTILGFECSFDKLIQILELRAEQTKSKIIFMIDALNESYNDEMWDIYLPMIQNIISNYKSVCFVVTARTTYAISYELSDKICPSIEHCGFGYDVEKYVDIFFQKNNLESPNMPFLHDEFSNPQFLFLLCKAMKDDQQIDINKDSIDILTVYKLFINSINDKLQKPTRLRYDPDEKIIDKSIQHLVILLIKNSNYSIKYEDANNCLNEIYPASRSSSTLLTELINEGLIIKNNTGVPGNRDTNIQFIYERLSEHLIIENYLNDTKTNVIDLITKGKLSICFTNYTDPKNKGLVDAILIQFPEQFKIEIVKILPKKFMKNELLIQAILASYRLRKLNNIPNEALSSIYKNIKTNKIFDEFFKTLITTSTSSNPNINVEYLHKILIDMKLAERDYKWSTFLSRNYKSNGITKHYIEWAKNKKYGDEQQSLYLSSVTLCWFLTSSHNIIRDNTTNGIIEILNNNLDMWFDILQKFKNCNDPYVHERLYMITYALVLLNPKNTSTIKKIAMYVHLNIFKNCNMPKSILLRDHARNIIMYAKTLVPDLKIKQSNIDPPYARGNIILPRKNIINLRIKKILDAGKPKTNADYGLFDIYSSLSDMGDFFRYVIGSNSNTFPWYNIPLIKGKSIIEPIVSFRKHFSEDKKKIFDEYLLNISEMNLNPKKIPPEFTEIESKKITKIIIPCLNKIKKHQNIEFDYSKIGNWIANEIIRLGWNKKYFGEFDYTINKNRGSYDEKYERIGKKYQWIAYYKLLAIISDNFEFKKLFGPLKYSEYKGTWQIHYFRKFDPTWLRNDYDSTDLEKTSITWLPNVSDDVIRIDATKWLKKKKDLPPLKNIIEISNSDSWLLLNGEYDVKQKISHNDSIIECTIYYIINGYICNKKDKKKMLTWLSKQTSRSINEYLISDTYLGELYWHESVDPEYMLDTDWQHTKSFSNTSTIKYYNPSIGILQEELLTLNNTTMKILFPNKFLVDKMNLKNNLNGKFIDDNDKIATFNIDGESTTHALLIKKNMFIKFLKDNNCNIIWHVVGEKQLPHTMTLKTKKYQNTRLTGTYDLFHKKIRGNLKAKYTSIKI